MCAAAIFPCFKISIHSLRMEGDGTMSSPPSPTLYFNPLPPHGGRRGSALICSMHQKFQSTPSAWRETHFAVVHANIAIISIHSLRMEGDPCPVAGSQTTNDFNPLPPHGGRRLLGVPLPAVITFQSTPSAWRETDCSGVSVLSAAFQSTPSAWRETAKKLTCVVFVEIFQSTPSAWRETTSAMWIIRQLSNFNPLPPHGGRHLSENDADEYSDISIHSLRMEGDPADRLHVLSMTYFNPLPPHGGRLKP